MVLLKHWRVERADIELTLTPDHVHGKGRWAREGGREGGSSSARLEN